MRVPEFFPGSDATRHASARTIGAEAERLAKLIMRRWAEVGQTNVRAWVETRTQSYQKKSGDVMETATQTGHVIRSNLVNGLPPRTPFEKAA